MPGKSPIGKSSIFSNRMVLWGILAGLIVLVVVAIPLEISLIQQMEASAIQSSQSPMSATDINGQAITPSLSSNPSTPSPVIEVTDTIEPSPTVVDNTPTIENTPIEPTQPPTPEPAIQSGWNVIGASVEGRSMDLYAIGEGPLIRMIVAGIHGGYEWNTIALADEMITYVSEYPDIIPEDVTLYILRDLNPDGEARQHGLEGRANANGVDLNRNFPSFWKEGLPQPGCWNYLQLTSGSGPASEPETRALMAFILDNNVDALISYHSAALGIFPGGQPPDADSTSLAEAVSAVSDYAYPPVDTGCPYAGQLIDWASQQGVASLDIELTNHTDTDFNQNLKILKTFLKWRR